MPAYQALSTDHRTGERQTQTRTTPAGIASPATHRPRFVALLRVAKRKEHGHAIVEENFQACLLQQVPPVVDLSSAERKKKQTWKD
jgi:hypothetical protein